MLNSCHLQALAEDLCTDSHKFLRFRIGYLICAKKKIDSGDPLEDKIHTKMRFTCLYRWANIICTTPITKGLSSPFKSLR